MMSLKRKAAWAIGMGLANALILSKGDPAPFEDAVAFCVGAFVGVFFAFAAESPTTKKAALIKMVYWPAAVSIFWTFLFLYPQPEPISRVFWAFVVTFLIGFAIGFVHYLATTRRSSQQTAKLP